MGAAAAQTVRLDFDRRPRAWRYMLTAFYPSPGLPQGRAFPDIHAHWSGYAPPARNVEDFARLCGMNAKGDPLPALYPHAAAFRLQMALLTHTKFPVPIWRVLQVRNQLLQLRPIPARAALDFDCRVHAHRVLEKGLEVDLHTTVMNAGELACESLNTFYVRGRFGPPSGLAAATADAPPAGENVLASWHMPGGEGWRFGGLTGDYNGIHVWDRYARLFGFKRAFFHPLRVVGQSLSRAGLGQQSGPSRLNVWLKGPVYQDSDVHLRTGRKGEDTVLELLVGDDPRPAIISQLSAAAADSRLVTLAQAHG